MTKAFFVAGTDTEVGKTFASCALLEAVNQLDKSTMGLKPVAAGCEEIDGEWKNEDAILLQQHMSVDLPYAQVNPIALKTPASPHIAAYLEKKTVSVSRIVGFCRGALMGRPDFALVEGAGGWRVPLSNRETMADLARQLGHDVILVVGLRLGCLNHAMLTAEAIRRDGLNIAGWIANSVSSEPMSFENENIATLKSALNAPFMGKLPNALEGGPKSVCNQLVLDCLEL